MNVEALAALGKKMKEVGNRIEKLTALTAVCDDLRWKATSADITKITVHLSRGSDVQIGAEAYNVTLPLRQEDMRAMVDQLVDSLGEIAERERDALESLEVKVSAAEISIGDEKE